MKKQIDEFNILSQKYLKCQRIMEIMGDPIRQLLVRCMIENKGNEGFRVGELQSYTDLSRTTISHHLKVLKDCNVISMDRKGTKNYYYIDSNNTTLIDLINFWKEVESKLK